MTRFPFAITLASVLLAPTAAFACGGFFCSAVDPVLQSGERILFQVGEDDDGATTVTTVVEIQFEGAASDFGWVLPIPEVIDTEDVSTAPPGLFDELEEATAMQFVTASEGTAGLMMADEAAGCYGPPSPFWWMEEDSPSGGGSFTFDQVDVVGEAVVGPYAIEIITSEDASQLTGWLQNNGYSIPGTAFEPIAHYVSSGSAFLGLKLQPDVPEGPIDALRFTYRAEDPSLPLHLTSVAAAQDMEVIAYVLADERYLPAGYDDVDFDYGLVSWTDEGTDYDERLGAAIDFAGGRAFQTEFAGAVSNLPAGEASADLLSGGTYLTRMRTFVSPEEMTMDPVWRPAPEAPDVSNVRVIGGSETASRGAPSAPARATMPVALAFGLLLLSARRRA